MQYNGLQSDFNSLAKFVFIYETMINKRMNKENDFLQLSSKAFYLFKHKLQPNMKFATVKEIENLPEQAKQTLFFTKQKVQIIDFCRHLRNSFSHGLLKKENNRIIISDIGRGNCTSKGFLEYRIVIEFVIEIVREYENTNKSKKQNT